MKHYIATIAALAFIPLVACSAQIETQDSQQLAGEISVSDPYVVPPFPGRDVAAGFFGLSNTGGNDRLVSASSPDSRAIEIHTHIEDDGVMRMRRIEGVAIGAGETVNFEQGGYHLMLFGVTLKEGQEVIDVTLNYETAAPVTLTVPIRQHAQPSYGSASQGSGTDVSNAKGSGTHGSGTHGSATEGSDAKGSATHYGSGSETGEESPKTKSHGSGH